MRDAQLIQQGIHYDDILAAERDAADSSEIEVVDGQIIEVTSGMTWLHTLLIQNLFNLLQTYVRDHQLGTVWIDGVRYVIVGNKTNIQTARRPDLSFLRKGRIPADFDWNGDFYGAPDFALEVQSPGQTHASQLARVSDFLANGTQEAWIIYPTKEQVFQYRLAEDAPRVYGKSDLVDTSGLFPGLQVKLADLMTVESR